MRSFLRNRRFKNFAFKTDVLCSCLLLNSKTRVTIKETIDCRVKTIRDANVTINNESLISGSVPTTSLHIPVIVGHSSTNDSQEVVFYDGGKWIIRSNTSQEITIRFYRCTK